MINKQTLFEALKEVNSRGQVHWQYQKGKLIEKYSGRSVTPEQFLAEEWLGRTSFYIGRYITEQFEEAHPNGPVIILLDSSPLFITYIPEGKVYCGSVRTDIQMSSDINNLIVHFGMYMKKYDYERVLTKLIAGYANIFKESV